MTSPMHALAWHGWTLTTPADWNPVRIEGDSAHGTLLLADLHAPQLGLHWTTPSRRADVNAAVERRLIDEVGKLAAAEAVACDLPDVQHGRLYADPQPPGRDVFVGHSPRSGRLLTVVYHAAERSDALGRTLRTLADTPSDAATRWSAFDFTFTTPPRWRLRAERLNAGHLAFLLAGPDRQTAVLRQIAPAALALARQPLAAWAKSMPFTTPKHYRDDGDAVDAQWQRSDGSRVTGLRRRLRRRRRLCWAWFLPRSQTVLAAHDTLRDKCVLVQGADESVLADLLRSAIDC